MTIKELKNKLSEYSEDFEVFLVVTIKPDYEPYRMEADFDDAEFNQYDWGIAIEF